ncbi:MAG: AraC family transcriptional regulator [Spirochaetes bacterium]|nr:AraC family transcriptional regulator [Spirochaetota bacterium]
MLNIEAVYLCIANQITLFGCGFCIVRAIEFAIETGRHHVHHVVFNAFNSVILFGISMFITGTMRTYPATAFLFPTCLFLAGPLNLLFYQQILYPKKPAPAMIWVYLLPAMAVFLVEILFQLQPADFKREMASSFIDNPTGHSLTVVFGILIVQVTAYYALIIKAILSDVNAKESRRALRYVLIIAATIIVSIYMLLFGFIFHATWLFAAGGVLITFVHISYYIGQRIFPSFFVTLKSRIRKRRYDTYIAISPDAEIVRNRLVDLMEDEKMFLDYNISLNSVAEKLSIKPHQFSQVLNAAFRTGFWDFINRYRIDEAARLIREDPEASILSICFRTGFNSKSSFNTAFKKFTGMTPTEYRVLLSQK